MGLSCNAIAARNIEAARVKAQKNQCEAYALAQIGNMLTQGINMVGNGEKAETPPKAKEEEPVKNNDDYKEKVIDILGKDTFNKLPKELQENVLNKYNTYKTVMKYDDVESARRLNNYLKALNSRESQKKMGEYLEQALETEENEGLDNCPIVDVDANIAKQKINGSDEEFIQSLIDRGEGYLDMYDTNNDGKVDIKEFTDFEAKDSGQALTTEEKAVTEAYFNTISGGDGVIDAKDFASHLAAVARLYDGNTKSTVEDITYKEWFGAQMVGSDESITRNYNVWKNGYSQSFQK